MRTPSFASHRASSAPIGSAETGSGASATRVLARRHDDEQRLVVLLLLVALARRAPAPRTRRARRARLQPRTPGSPRREDRRRSRRHTCARDRRTRARDGRRGSPRRHSLRSRGRDRGEHADARSPSRRPRPRRRTWRSRRRRLRGALANETVAPKASETSARRASTPCTASGLTTRTARFDARARACAIVCPGCTPSARASRDTTSRRVLPSSFASVSGGAATTIASGMPSRTPIASACGVGRPSRARARAPPRRGARAG